MPTLLRSTCLVSATFRIPGGAEGLFRPWQLDFCHAKGTEVLFRPWQPGFCFAGGAEGFLRPWQLDFCAARGKWLLFCPWRKKLSEAEGLFSELGSVAGRGGAGEGSAAAGAVGTAPVPAPAGSEDGSRARSSPGGKRDKREKLGKRGKRSGQAGPLFTFVPFVFGIMLSGHSDPEIFAKIPDCAYLREPIKP